MLPRRRRRTGRGSLLPRSSGGVFLLWRACQLVSLVSSSRVVAAVWVVAFAWMGIGCVLNARRCHRMHCYFSGPILLLGAVAGGLLATGVVSLGALAINNTISITLVLALLSFVPEATWGQVPT